MGQKTGFGGQCEGALLLLRLPSSAFGWSTRRKLMRP